MTDRYGSLNIEIHADGLDGIKEALSRVANQVDSLVLPELDSLTVDVACKDGNHYSVNGLLYVMDNYHNVQDSE